jgi:vitamin B12 transporter
MKRACLLLAGLAALAAARSLAAQNLYVLDTLHVTVGSRADARLPAATRAVEVVTADEIARLPARTLADALAWALGADVQARSAMQADVSLRGAGAEQVLVLVDGVRATDPQTAHFALDQTVPLDDVERIEVLRGPASALYGADAVGGVVNIVTRGTEREASARVEGGSHGTAVLRLNGGTGPAALAAAGALELERSAGFRPGTDYRAGSARASLGARLGGRTLRADAGYAVRDFGARAFYTSPQAPFDEYEKTRTTTLLLSWAAPSGVPAALEPHLSLRRHDDDFVLQRDQPSFYRNVHHSWQLGGDLVGRRTLAGARLAGGVEAYRDLLRSSSLGDHDESRAGAFAELSAGDRGRAALTAGLRADWHSRFGSFVAPSLAGALRLSPALRVRASLGRAFRAPTWTERYYVDPSNVGDPDLKPERAWEAEAGADLGAGGPLRLKGSLFLRRAENLIDWLQRPDTGGSSTVWQAANLGRVTFRGAELEGMALDRTGTRWILRATLLGFHADEAVAASKYALRPLTRTASLAAERALLGGLGVGARLAYARRPPQPGYWLADMRVRVGWRSGEAYIDGRNLFNTRYLDISTMPAPGRAFSLGAGWTLPR